MANYLQGKFIPQNPQKYIGDSANIIYRSSWEKKAFIFLDNNPSILKWNSEENIIPYVSPVDNRMHRYFVDLSIQYKTKSGDVKNAIIEIKPKAQTMPPKLTKTGKQSKRFLNESVTYMVNQAKWSAAKAWAEKNGWSFLIWTEVELGIK